MSYQTKDLEEIVPQWRARLEDVLGVSTREKRRLLLIVSTLSLVGMTLGLFPTKIEALGIVIEGKNQHDLLLILAAVEVYAMLGFFLYAWADFMLQYRLQTNANTGYINEFIKGKAKLTESLNYFLRVIFDFFVPFAYGGYALYRLYFLLHP